MTNDNDRRIILPGEDRAIRSGFRTREKVLSRREARGLAETAIQASQEARAQAEILYKLLRVVQSAIRREVDRTRGPFLGLHWRVPWVRKGHIKAWAALLPPPAAVAEADAAVGLETPSAEVDKCP